MKKLKELPGSNTENMAVIKQKMPEKKILLIGISLCLLLAFLLFLLGQKVTSQKAELTKQGEAIYSPVDGIIFEMLIPKGKNVRKGDALIHFDPAYIRSKTAEIREYLQVFNDNKHNAGTLKQIFKPLLADVFSDITKEITQLSETEAQKLKELQGVVREHTKAQVAMRRPNSFADGKPDPELVKKEQELQKKYGEAEEAFQTASLARASADKKYRDLTNSLGQPNSILYRYLEEEYNRTLALQKNEYIYAPFNAVAGVHYVKNGSAVKKDEILMDIHPENAEEWWVLAEFTKSDAKKLKERELCTVITEDNKELTARIFSIEDKQDNALVKLFILDAPEDLKASEFVTVKSR